MRKYVRVTGKYIMGLLLAFVMFVNIAGCTDSESGSNESIEPPLEGIKWGMLPEDVIEIMDLSSEIVLDDDGGIATLQYKDLQILGHKADVLLSFQMKPQMGLSNLSLSFEDLSKEEIAELLLNRYGECQAVDSGGIPCLWEGNKIEELPENVQKRFQYMKLEWMKKGQDSLGFSQETVWNSLKKQPLVKIVYRGGSVVEYSGENMAAYYIYADDAMYEKYLKEFE